MITYDDIKPFHEGRLTVAPAVGIMELDNHIRFKRNFTVVGGIGNVGKTTAWMYILFVWAMFHPEKLKFLMFLNENNEKEMAMQMIEWHNAKDIRKHSKTEINASLKWINEHFSFLENDYKSTLEQLLYKFWYIKRGTHGEKKFDYDGVFIDPYNSLPVYNGYAEHYKNASAFRGFCKENNVKVMVSMHVNTEAQRKRDDEGLVKVPHVVDLEMGSMWFNRSDDSVVIHRHIQDAERKGISELHVQKIKHKRSGGEPTDSDSPIMMTWNSSLAGRFVFDETGDPLPTPKSKENKNIKFDKKKKKDEEPKVDKNQSEMFKDEKGDEK